MLQPFNLQIAPPHIANANEGSNFRIAAKGAELLIMDDIGQDIFGEGISAKDVQSWLTDNRGQEISVKINSLGGSFYDGLAMYNAFLAHDAPIHATVQGVAYSAATLPAMGATTLAMAKRSDFGIHRAWTIAAGNQNQLRGTLEWLEKVDDHLVSVYQDKTGASPETIIDWMAGTDDGTVFSAEGAIEAGFADSIIGEPAEPINVSKGLEAAAQIRRQKLKAMLRS